MNQRQPELGRALELALGEPVPPYGLQERVRRALDQRLATASVLRARTRFAWAAVAGLVLGALLTVHFTSSGQRHPGDSSALTLRAARLMLGPNTELAVDRDDERGSSLRLESGTVLIHVQKGTGRSFEVLAGETRVEVVGTIFGVSRPANGKAAVEVVEGVVRVMDPNGERRLEAGQRWPAGTVLFDDPTKLAQLRVPIVVRPADVGRAHEPSTPASDVNPTDSAATAAADKDAVGAHVPKPPSAGGAPARGGESSANEQADYARAKSLELAGDRASAIAAYDALSARTQPIAEDALFSVLRLRAAEGQYGLALTTVGRYRARFPSGRYARDVDVQALSADTALGDESAALAEADAFIGKFPEDPRAWRFRLVRARERAGRGDCAGALADLARVPASPAKDAAASACDKH